MKYFMIKYTFKNGAPEDWHNEVAGFIAALDSEPALQNKISYRCMKVKNSSDYLHLAGAADDAAIATLQSQDFFKRYNARTREVSGGSVEVVPLEIIAQTAARAD